MQIVSLFLYLLLIWTVVVVELSVDCRNHTTMNTLRIKSCSVVCSQLFSCLTVAGCDIPIFDLYLIVSDLDLNPRTFGFDL